MADVWSSGVMLYVMLFGQYPFERPEDKKEANRCSKLSDFAFTPLSCLSQLGDKFRSLQEQIQAVRISCVLGMSNSEFYYESSHYTEAEAFATAMAIYGPFLRHAGSRRCYTVS